ncbi:MAG: twin transmembrane helix small protein [Gammaproteobacteria bacterium]|nr:twin transmembrane helix small protein [Gammaproteobacteria bacterium]
MISSPLIRLIVIATFIFIVISLGTAFFHLMRDRGDSDKAVKALTYRVGLSVALFIFLMVMYATGVIGPGQ